MNRTRKNTCLIRWTHHISWKNRLEFINLVLVFQPRTTGL